MIAKTIETKYGKAHLGNDGYYRVRKDNTTKVLHRLIYEDHHKLCLLKGVILHHIDGNKLNNELDNLMPMFTEDHTALHMSDNHPFYGKHHSEKTKEIISKKNKGNKHSDDLKLTNSILTNTTGFFRVTKNKNKKCKQGFTWNYQYYDDDGKHCSISSVDIDKLKEKVLSKGLEWRVIN